MGCPGNGRPKTCGPIPGLILTQIHIGTGMTSKPGRRATDGKLELWAWLKGRTSSSQLGATGREREKE